MPHPSEQLGATRMTGPSEGFREGALNFSNIWAFSSACCSSVAADSVVASVFKSDVVRESPVVVSAGALPAAANIMAAAIIIFVIVRVICPPPAGIASVFPQAAKWDALGSPQT
jgi:hypothetical protein